VTSLAGLWTTACIGRIRREAESGSVIFRQQGRRGRARATDGWARWLFRLSIVALAFSTGMYVAWARVFPWDFVRTGVKTFVNLVGASSFLDSKWTFVSMPGDSVEARRVHLVGSEILADPVIMAGGRWHFRKHCPPADKCLAAELSNTGKVVHAWPFHVHEIKTIGTEIRHEKPFGVHSSDLLELHYSALYSNGDFLAVYVYPTQHFPPYVGMARIGRDGRRLWYRKDGSHHEPYVAAGDTVWVAGVKLEDRRFKLETMGWDCPDLPAILDVVNVVDGDGALIEQFSLQDAFAEPRWSFAARQTRNPCDPFHLNSVASVGKDVSELVGVEPGDMVLSLRNMDAFVILDRETGKLHQLVRGSFREQHSVKHLGGSKFILFDNKGRGNSAKQVSRVLIIDAADNREITVFPRNLEDYGFWYVERRGRLSLSQHKTRVIASYSELGKAVEVRIADGEVLAEFENLHDVDGLKEFAGGTGVARLGTAGDVFYANERREH